MISMKKILLCAAVVVLCSSSQTFGSIIAQYKVSSTSVVNNNDGAAHGLWTNGDVFGTAGSSHNYYDIQDMLFTQYSDGTATLIGTAINPFDTVAHINLTYSSFMDAVTNVADYKQEGGLAYDSNLHDFYDSIIGNITFKNLAGDTTYGDVTIDNYVSTYKFQMGLGANAKSKTEFGGSAWIQDAGNGDGSGEMSSHHWDLNLSFDAVPEPTTMVIWTVLLSMLFPFSRRRTAFV